MYVCGQEKLLFCVNDLITKQKFPRFIILVGGFGFGKKLLCDYISKQLGANFVPCGIKMDEVRQVIENAYTVTEKTLYMFFDSDSMSSQSKNALLKVTEEPPNDCYFVLTLQDLSTALDTIISRATVFYLEPYSINQIEDFIDHKGYIFKDSILEIVKQICICPQDVITAYKENVEEVYNLANKFIKFVGRANLSNELKIITLLNTKKEDSEKIDSVLFLKCVLICCNKEILNEDSEMDISILYSIIKETDKCLQELSSKSSNKIMVLDNWILRCHIGITGGEL